MNSAIIHYKIAIYVMCKRGIGKGCYHNVQYMQQNSRVLA